MSKSSDNFPRFLVAGMALIGLWLVIDKVSAPSEESYLENSVEPFIDAPAESVGSAPTTDPSQPEDPAIGKTKSLPSTSLAHGLNEQNQQAIEWLKEKRYREAEDLFRKCYLQQPEEPAFASNLAEALVRRAIAEFDAKPKESFVALIEATRLVPDHADLKKLEERWAKILEAQDGFAEDQSQHFVLQYDGSRDELLSTGYLEVLQDLEAAYQDYGEFFDIFPVEQGHAKFAVVLYDRDVFDSVTGIGEWAGGAFDGTIRVPVRNFQRDHARIREVLRHELVHAFIQVIGGKRVPGWLNEGLAQYLSPIGNGQRELQVQSAIRRLKGKTTLPLSDLTGTLAALPNSQDIRIAYDQSLGLTHWIAFHYGERTLVPMVTGCKRNLRPGESFEAQIHIPLSAASRDFLDSL